MVLRGQSPRIADTIDVRAPPRLRRNDWPVLRVAYVVSRFPTASETFIVRELNEVARDPALGIELCSLFPPVAPVVHPSAASWAARLRRPAVRDVLTGIAYWALRRPPALLTCVVIVVRAFARHPNLLVRALVTLAIACAHARTLRESRVRHVHAHFATYPTLAAWAAWRLAGIPYSFTAHAQDLYVDQSFLSRAIAEARFAVTISEHNRRFMAPYGGDSATPVHVVRCGVDPTAYRFRPRKPPAAGPVRALCVASLEEYKGHRYLLEALADGPPALRRIELDLVGDGRLRSLLEREVHTLRLAGRVRFHGRMTEPEVADRLDQADLFVLPSIVIRRTGLMEGIPVALMEAMAVGVPVVATRISGIPELVRHEESGLLAEHSDAASLRGMLIRALEDLDAWDARLEAARATIESTFDVRREAERIAGLLRDAAGVGSA